jgi:hypothetical protein
MLPNQSPCILSIRPSLFPETRSVGCIIEGKDIFLKDFILMDIGDRDFRRRNQKIFETFDLKKLLFKFGELPRARHGRPIDHKRRKHLPISMLPGMEIQHKVDEGSL